jgi:PII-like signaling protein
MYEGKHLYKYLVEFFRKEGLAGATVLRGIDGFGKSSHAHTTSILRLSTDLPIVVEVADTQAKIDVIKPKLDAIVTEGLITEEKVKIILYKGNNKKSS